MEKINIIINTYKSINDDRNKELKFSLDKLNDLIGVTITEIKSDFRIKFIEFAKLSHDNSINIWINSDCFFDQSSIDLLNHLKDDEVWCLSRREMIDFDISNSVYVDRPDTQDAWIFHGVCPIPDDELNFEIGTVGCDNHLMYLFSKFKKIKNPSIDIKLYHMHLSKYRNYDISKSVIGEYLTLYPHKI